MAKRYIGDAEIEIRYVGYRAGRDTYSGTIRVPGCSWKFSDLGAPQIGFDHGYDSPQAYDKMAAAAASFAAYYTTHNRGDDVPDWAPTPECADAISGAVEYVLEDDGSYQVRRSKTGPTRLGELVRAPKRASMP